MKASLFCLGACLIGQVALAQNLPAPKVGSCPRYTYSSGGSCVPNGNHQVYLNSNRSSGCPLGWTSSGNYCVR